MAEESLPRKRRGGTEDFWDVTQDIEEEEECAHWTEKTEGEKVLTITWVIGRIMLALCSLYFFVCSLDFLSNAFQLLGGKEAGKVIKVYSSLSKLHLSFLGCTWLLSCLVSYSTK